MRSPRVGAGLAAVLHFSPPGPRDGAERREPREGGAWPPVATPWGGAPESPSFHSPPTLSPTAESGEDRKARGLSKWWVWTGQLSPGAQRGCKEMEGSSTAWGCADMATEACSLSGGQRSAAMAFGFLGRLRGACPCPPRLCWQPRARLVATALRSLPSSSLHVCFFWVSLIRTLVIGFRAS